jgi:lauroyl/myristoyl acyltransferase
VVVGTDPFAILPAIQHLQEGGAVALLIDRPSSNASVTIELFNRPFRASLAAAELARASGCAIVPVAIVRGHDGYDVVVRKRIDYDRARLRDPAARRELTQEILRALEPLIRQYPEQWFHFIPIWPDAVAQSSAVSASSF